MKRIHKILTAAGTTALVLGIVTAAVGVTAGAMGIITGARLLHARRELEE